MHHLAILSKKWKLLELILEGKKTIESRWYQTKRAPWNRINRGDVIFLKDSGEPVTAKADVKDVLQFELNEDVIKQIIEKYGQGICLKSGYERFLDKKYCILVFLKNPERIKPFKIDKSGFGLMSAWITVKDINELKPSPFFK